MAVPVGHNEMMTDNFLDSLEKIAERVQTTDYFKYFVSPSARIVDELDTESQILRGDLPLKLVSRAQPGSTIFILGGPGSGKTILWHMLTEAAIRCDPPLVPVRFNVHWLAKHETRQGLLHATLAGLFTDQQIGELDRERRLLLLIDGLNEIAYSTTITERARTTVSDMIDGPEHCPVIATSRVPVPTNLRLPGSFKEQVEILLKRFEDQQVDELLHKHGLDVQCFHAYLGTARLEQLASNPHLLSMLLSLFEVAPEVPAPNSVVELFERFFEVKWQQFRDIIDRADVVRTPFVKALSTLAWHMQVHGKNSVAPAEWSDLLSPFADALQRDGIDQQMIIDRAHAYYVMELDEGSLQFVHERYQNHYAGHFLHELGEIPEAIWQLPQWEDTLAHLAGLCDENKTRALLRAAIERGRTALACKLAAANWGRLGEEQLDRLFVHVATCLYDRRTKRD